MSIEEFDAFERKWKFYFSYFGIALICVVLALIFRSPRGIEAIVCYSLGALSVIVCLVAAYKLRDERRRDAVMDGLEALVDDISVSDLND